MIIVIEAHFTVVRGVISVNVPSHDPLYWRRSRPWAQMDLESVPGQSPAERFALAVDRMYERLHGRETPLGA